MRMILTAVLVLAPALLIAQVEQQPRLQDAAGQSAAHQDRIAPNTLLMAELKATLDTRTLHSGDAFEAILCKDVTYQEKVVLPAGARLVGRVAQAQRLTGSQASFLYLLLEKVIVPDGREIKFWAAVERVEASAGKSPQKTTSAPPRLDASQKAPATVHARSEWEEERQSASPSGGAWPTGQKSSTSASPFPPVSSKSPPVDVRTVSDAAGNTFTLLFSTKEDLKIQKGSIIAFRVLP
jgi:hypothetical protein